MTRWEYLIVQDTQEIHSPGRLNELGSQGWELVGFDSRNVVLFKRRLSEKAEIGEGDLAWGR